MRKKCNAIILAAGRSSRFGQSKIELKLNDGSYFIENIVKQYFQFNCQNVIIVANAIGEKVISALDIFRDKRLIVLSNNHVELGRNHSIKIGLTLCNKYKNPVFLHNYDNPFAGQKLLSKLYKNRKGAEIIKPTYKNQGGHPILISAEAVNRMIQNIDYSTNFREEIANFSIKEIAVNHKGILININSKEEYIKFKDDYDLEFYQRTS